MPRDPKLSRTPRFVTSGRPKLAERDRWANIVEEYERRAQLHERSASASGGRGKLAEGQMRGGGGQVLDRRKAQARSFAPGDDDARGGRADERWTPPPSPAKITYRPRPPGAHGDRSPRSTVSSSCERAMDQGGTPVNCSSGSIRTVSFRGELMVRPHGAALLAVTISACGAASIGNVSDGRSVGESDSGAVVGAGDSGTIVWDASPQVGSCESLPANGTWEDVTPPVGAIPANETLFLEGLAVDPIHLGTVYASTGNYPAQRSTGFFKSTDCGAHWTASPEGSIPHLPTGIHWQIGVDRATSYVYTVAGYGSNGFYRSVDQGETWSEVTPTGAGVPKFVHLFSLDPTSPNHIWVDFHDDCRGMACGSSDPQHTCGCLAESTDAGDHWRTLVGPLKGWAEQGHPLAFGDALLYTANFGGLWYSGDSGATWQEKIAGAGCFTDLYPGPDGAVYVGCSQSLGIQKSTDRGQSWQRLPNSSPSQAVADTGTYKYAAGVGAVYRAPLSDLTKWSVVTGPPMKSPTQQPAPQPDGLAYDSAHHILYVQNFGAFGNAPGALWRFVTD